jgi:multisubunit Na+/H+ antiporter MnhB subunit
MIDMVIRAGLIVATGFVFTIILLEYLRIRNKKMLLMSIGFGIFFLSALVHIPALFVEEFKLMWTENINLMINLIGLIFVALGILKD